MVLGGAVSYERGTPESGRQNESPMPEQIVTALDAVWCFFSPVALQRTAVD